jgi:hypothetical protein
MARDPRGAAVKAQAACAPIWANLRRVARIEALEEALRRLAPRIPRHELGAVIDHARASPGLRTAAPEAAAWLSLVAYIRHALTDYDELLDEGYDAESARFFVRESINEVLEEWRAARRVGEGE